MTPAQLHDLCMQPGPIGTRFRLVKLWNPDGVGLWVQGEHDRGTPWQALGPELAEVMAAAAMGFAMNMEPPETFLLDPVMGVIPNFQKALQEKIRTRPRVRPANTVDSRLFIPKQGD